MNKVWLGIVAGDGFAEQFGRGSDLKGVPDSHGTQDRAQEDGADSKA